MTDVLLRSTAVMDTVATIQIVGHGDDAHARSARALAADAALEWFRRVEACCSRFDETSEVSRVTASDGHPVPVSEMLFEAVRFALAVAEDSGGAFDPTVGRQMEANGFDREHRTGRRIQSAADASNPVSYRDVRLDATRRTVTLRQPLVLDLGAVAKGLAVDMAARELAAYRDFAIDAGGDLYFSGENPQGTAWRVGIRDPRGDHDVLEAIAVMDAAVCTSGDYERTGREKGEHHILDPRTGESASALASVTVVAPTAMVADALATAAFVLGPARGVEFLERHGVDGLLIAPDLGRYVARGPMGSFKAS